MQTPQRIHDAGTVSPVVPEKILPLGQFLLRRYGRENLFAGVRMHPAVVNLCGHRHWRGSEILHLLQMKIKVAGLYGKFSHVRLRAAGVR